MIGLILLCHGSLADSIAETAQSIVGPVEGMLALTNSGKSQDVVRGEIDGALSSLSDCEGVLVMVDLFGSSCWCHAVRRAGQRPPDDHPIAVIGGINLGAVLSFSRKRDTHDLQSLAEALAGDTMRGIAGPEFGPRSGSGPGSEGCPEEES
jgi:mannose/fructose-specific phosphotransferase system component IIA